MESVSVVKRNIIANTVGGMWVLAISLFLVPTQFKILGSEIVGLLGFVATFQMIFTIFDFGLAPTILREVASDNSSDREISRELIQSASVVYWIVAILLGSGLALSASWFTQHWITLDTLTPEFATRTIQILALRLFVSWTLALYSNVLAGIQRLDIVNLLRVFTNTTSAGGGIIILIFWRDLHIFLWWTIAVAILSLALHIMACYRAFPKISLIPKFSGASFKRIWRFSLDMNIISIQAILLTQMDNILVSYLLPLKMLGYYTGAYSINQKSIATLGGFLADAMLPTLSEDFGHGRTESLRSRFQKYSQIVNYIAVLPTFIFIFWGYDVLRIWTNLEVAQGAYITLAILSIGFLFNTMMSPCYILAVATSHTRIPRNINLVGTGIYLVLCYLFIRQWGINGAAMAWVLLNVYYLFTLLPMTQFQILNANPLTWVYKNFLPFTILAFLSFSIGRTILSALPLNNEFVIWGICVVCAGCYSLSGFFFLENTLQKDIRQMIMRIINAMTSFTKPKRKPISEK